MTEPMRESSCGRCRALDLVVAEKDSEIASLRTLVRELEIENQELREKCQANKN